MINNTIKYSKKTVAFLSLFILFWFLNSGFLTYSWWLVAQAGLFTVITFVIVKHQKIKLFFWFVIIGLLYILSSIFEIFKLIEMSVIAASTGFGILAVLIIFFSLKRGD